MTELIELLKTNNKLIIVLLVFIALDILTGVIKGILEKDLQSSIFREGLLKKVLELIIVIVGFVSDWAFSLEIVGHAVLIFLYAMEGYSILENITPYAPVPEFLKSFMNAKKEEVENDL